jgi:hypothetical protein
LITELLCATCSHRHLTSLNLCIGFWHRYLVLGSPQHFGEEGSVSVSVDAIIIIVLVTIFQLGIPRVLVPLSALCAVCGAVPLLAVIGGGAANNDLAVGLTQSGGLSTRRTDFGLLLSWMLWVNQGYFSVGLLVSEVASNQQVRAVMCILLTIVPLVTALTLLPLAAAWGAERNPEQYDSGRFQEIAQRLVADWFKVPFLVGAVMAELVLFSSASTAAHRVFHYVMQSQMAERLGPDAVTPTGSAFARRLWFDTRRGTPPGFVLLINLVLLPLAVWLPYRTLVQLAMLMAAPAIVAACAAFWKCRPACWSRGLILLPLITVGAMLFFVLCDDDATFSIPYFKAITGAALYGATAIFAICSRRRTPLKLSEKSHLMPAPDMFDARA